MKNDGVIYHQLLFPPEHWTKVVQQELAVVGIVYPLPCKYSVVQYFPINVIRHNEHHLRRTSCRAQFLWTTSQNIYVGCTSSRGGQPGCFHSFYWRFKFDSYERAQVLSIATIRQNNSI